MTDEYEAADIAYRNGYADGKAEGLDVEVLAREVTRLVMGDDFVRVNRWMTVGWRETMVDEGEALWAGILRRAILTGETEG